MIFHELSPRLLPYSILIALAAITSGCVTTHSNGVFSKPLTNQQCQNSNWKDIGYKDGTIGLSATYFSKYVKDCANVPGGNPDRALWEQGRQEGLKLFCTELNAYKLGREGLQWQPVCPMDNIEKLEEAYQQGYYYYLRQRDIDYFNSPYGWPNHYYHRPYGIPYDFHRRNDPFWYPRW